MSDMTAIREALAANLSSIADLQVSAYILANPTPPAAHILPGAVEYHQAMGNGAEWWEFRVQVFIAFVADIGSQQRLDRMLDSDGPESIKQAIESDRTLGGACEDLIVTERTGYQIFSPLGRGDVLGADWTVRVFV